MGIVLLVLIALTSCRTNNAVPEDADITMARKLIASELPDAPILPSFPKLDWSFQDDLYCISEADVDVLLDYVENSLREFRIDYEAWQLEVSLVIENLI